MPDRLGDQVSVVLLTYNCGHRLDRVLKEMGALGVPLIAVDNASSDNTVEVLRSSGIEPVVLPRNIGAAARNIGVDQVTTPYVVMCDDDGWFAAAGVRHAVDLLDRHPRLALVNARILVEPDGRLDPICAEMDASPLPDGAGIEGKPLLGFMAGAVIVRVSAYREVGGYDPQFFIGGEEETLAVKLARRGWQLRYVPDVVAYHEPSIANAPFLGAHRLRNTLWNCWLHRRFRSAVRWTVFILTSAPKNGDWARGVTMAVRGLPWVVRRRRPMSRDLDAQYRLLDRRHYDRRDDQRRQGDHRRGIRTGNRQKA